MSEAAPGRPTIIVGAPNSAARVAEGGLLLVAHSDTVPEGDHATWHHDPFGAEIDTSRLFGRGACDNKAGIAAGFFALVMLRQLGLLDGAPAALLCVPDE